MHEWGITRDLIDEVKNQATRNNLKKIIRVEVALGKKSDVTKQALTTCFEVLVKEELLLQNCKLEIKNTPDHKIIVNMIQGEQD